MRTGIKYHCFVGLFLSLLCSATVATEIIIPLSDGHHAVADYRPGESGKPAVFILHGFLQTSRYSTVQLIADELSDNGYTVLAPTLTLNIDQRRSGLGCDAIQNHGVANSNHEITEWMAWLRAQGHPQIIAIGHSSGSMRLLSYLSEHPAQPPGLFIATSIGPFGDWHTPQETQRQIAVAKQRVKAQPRHIDGYTLAFCKNNYKAPAEAYLSYMQWSAEWVLEQLHQLTIPVHVVLGRADTWLPPDWADRVATAGIPHTFVEDATHNFTGAQEFEFQELILKLSDASQSMKQ